jgi:hypothetical protein
VKVYCVWFPRLAGYMGKRGKIRHSLNNACCFWDLSDAEEWASVLGGEVRLVPLNGEQPEELSSAEAEEPF